MPTVIERELGIGQRAILAPLAVPWLVGATLVGLIAVLRRPLRFAPEWLLCLLPLVVVLLFFYAPRYRLPAIPLMCVLAAHALAHCRRFSVPTPLVLAAFLVPLPLYLVNQYTVNTLTLLDSPAYVRTYFVRATSEALGQAGARREMAGQPTEAEQHYRRALQLWHENALAHARLGSFYAKQRRMDEAVRELSEAIRLRPSLLPAQLGLYNALCTQQRYSEAARTLRSVTQRVPQHLSARLALAWLLATCPDDRVRNGPEALEHARAAQRLSATNRCDLLDVLAATQAELGRFDEAVRVGNAAVALARQQGSSEQAAEILERVDGYRDRQACRAAPRVLRLR